jgi:Tfp pilus assembly protein PilF
MSDSVSTRYKEALRRGHMSVVKGRPREAIKHYREAGELVPERPLPFVSIGYIHLRMRDPRDALEAFDEALEREPNDLEALRGRAAALEAAGDARQAGTVRARIAQLEVRTRTGQRSYAPVDRRALELERHVSNGAAARAAGDTATASAAYLAAANGFAAANDFDAAMDACLRALEAHPGNIDVHFTMAVLYLRRGWAGLGAQRAMLIAHRLDVDDDPRRRAALHALARDFRGLAPELERLAAPPA